MVNLQSWADAVTSVAGGISTVVLVNKSDLGPLAKVTSDRIEALCASKKWKWMMTSAKTGENVPVAFELVARLYIENLQRRRSPGEPAE